MEGIYFDETFAPIVGLNLSFSAEICARFQANPKETHLEAIKTIIRYVNDTINYDIWHSNDSNTHLVGFYDADWAENSNDRKSTSS